VDGQVHRLLVIFEVVFELLQGDPGLTSFLKDFLTFLHAIIQGDFRSILAADCNQFLQNFTLRKRKHLLLREVDLACKSTEDKRKGILRLVGDAIIPGESYASIGELDVLFCAEPVEASPEEVDVDAQDDLAEEDGIVVI
jgi:hypothetical protein